MPARSSFAQTNAHLEIIHREPLRPPRAVLQQGLVGQPLKQLLRLGTSEQSGPLLLRFQFCQQETRESVLFLLRELRRFIESTLQKLVHS